MQYKSPHFADCLLTTEAVMGTGVEGASLIKNLVFPTRAGVVQMPHTAWE